MLGDWSVDISSNQIARFDDDRCTRDYVVLHLEAGEAETSAMKVLSVEL